VPRWARLVRRAVGGRRSPAVPAGLRRPILARVAALSRWRGLAGSVVIVLARRRAARSQR
ncbi:MAG TPA: hypothetical protein VE465_06550, partial [Streptosporangiaceae bacterium]|nr:hypothetical protein [Streptosporangiaceae bacterium]